MTKILRCFIFAIVFVNLLCIPTFANSNSIEPKTKCSIEISCKTNEKVIANLNISLHKLADISADGSYSLTQQFLKYKFDLNIKSQSGWDTLAKTVNSYVSADKIQSTANGKTDKNGNVTFSNLSVGLYFISSADDTFSPFIVSAPTLSNGSWNYNLKLCPKINTDNPENMSKKFKILKEWNDSPKNRPDSICVDIYKDGKLFESVKLTAEKNWLYEWSTDEEHKWVAVERDVPSGYTVTIEQNKNTFIITNTANSQSHNPYTGFTSDYRILFIILTISGAVLLALGFLKVWRKNE